MPLVYSTQGQKFQIPQKILNRYLVDQSEPYEEVSMLNGQLLVQVFCVDPKEGGQE